MMKIEDYKKTLVEAEEEVFQTNSLLEVKKFLRKNGIRAPDKTIYIFAEDAFKRAINKMERFGMKEINLTKD